MLDALQLRHHQGDDALGQPVLNREDTVQAPVLTLGLNVMARSRLDQLSGDPNGIAAAPRTAF